MATYSTEFDEYATGSLPSDWTQIGHGDVDATVEEYSGSVSGQVLEVAGGSGTTNYGFAAYPNELADIGGDVTLRTRFFTTGSVKPAPIVARGDGTPGVSGFTGVNLLGGNSGFEIWTLSVNNGTSTGDVYNPLNKWTCVLLEVFATDTHDVARYKIWAGDWEDEPVDWTRTVSSTLGGSFPQSGYCGIGGVRWGNNTAYHESLEVEYVAAPPPPGASVIFAAPTATTEITITHVTPGANADTHDLYAADDPADLELPIDPGFLLAGDLGPTPAQVVDSGLTPGQTRYYRSIARNSD